MQLNHSTIDIEKASKEEIQKEIIRLQNKYIEQVNIDLALKKIIVSTYGVIGNSSFFMYDSKIAETITSQGQDIVKFVASSINKYFSEKWINDTKIHEQMNIEVDSNIEKEVIIYIASDSCFINFNDVINSTNYNGDSTEFILKFYELRLKKYLDKIFEIYSKRFNVENIQFMKLESISKSGIFLGKNKYILNTVWEQGNISYNSLENIIAKGGELIQKDTPTFIRTKLEKTIKLILKEGKSLDINKLSIAVKKVKNEFKLQEIEDISYNVKINDYDNFIIEDKIRIETISHCPIHIKAAAIYNYMLHNSKFKEKYGVLNSKDRVKYYYCKTKNTVFGFKAGQFPIEFAPEFDYDTMFYKTFITPINKILKVINISELNENLVVVDRWF